MCVCVCVRGGGERGRRRGGGQGRTGGDGGGRSRWVSGVQTKSRGQRDGLCCQTSPPMLTQRTPKVNNPCPNKQTAADPRQPPLLPAWTRGSLFKMPSAIPWPSDSQWSSHLSALRNKPRSQQQVSLHRPTCSTAQTFYLWILPSNDRRLAFLSFAEVQPVTTALFASLRFLFRLSSYRTVPSRSVNLHYPCLWDLLCETG